MRLYQIESECPEWRPTDEPGVGEGGWRLSAFWSPNVAPAGRASRRRRGADGGGAKDAPEFLLPSRRRLMRRDSWQTPVTSRPTLNDSAFCSMRKQLVAPSSVRCGGGANGRRQTDFRLPFFRTLRDDHRAAVPSSTITFRLEKRDKTLPCWKRRSSPPRTIVAQWISVLLVRLLSTSAEKAVPGRSGHGRRWNESLSGQGRFPSASGRFFRPLRGPIA